MKFRKKPVVIEAEKLTCKPDIFLMTYDPVDDVLVPTSDSPRSSDG